MKNSFGGLIVEKLLEKVPNEYESMFVSRKTDYFMIGVKKGLKQHKMAIPYIEIEEVKNMEMYVAFIISEIERKMQE